MAIADRKERAMREREHLILEHADDLLRFKGYLGLNLDELAERIEYSKATIYNHFKSKEDLVLGVATMHLATRHDLFGRALTFEGRTRERMFAVGMADQILSQLYPHGFPTLQLVRTPSIWEKTAAERRTAYFDKSGACIRVATEIIRQAKAEGDLGEGSASVEIIITGLVSLAKGAHLLADGERMFPLESGIEPLELLNENYQLYLDGVGWEPLGSDWDYDATEERIREELFGEELRVLQGG
ncbi:MAG: TetR/AcrR family transcriptional regulator [Verrucomicrobiota bacterium]